MPAVNPKWTRIANVRAISFALTKFYKPDRLTGDPVARIQRIRAELDRDDGLTILASKHESNTGRALWIHDRGVHGFDIYQSDK